MSAAGGSNPEYVTARVRARKSALYGDEEYRKLVRMGPAEIARFMEESDYEAEINALGARHSGVDLIEYALNRNLAKQFDDLLGWADGRLYGLIARYLRKFDAWNVKTVIRGLYSGADREDVEDDLIRAGEFDGALIDSLLGAPSIEEVVERLSGTMFGDDLEAAYEDYEARAPGERDRPDVLRSPAGRPRGRRGHRAVPGVPRGRDRLPERPERAPVGTERRRHRPRRVLH